MVFLLKIHGFLDVVLCQLVNSCCCFTVQDTLLGLLESKKGAVVFCELLTVIDQLT